MTELKGLSKTLAGAWGVHHKDNHGGARSWSLECNGQWIADIEIPKFYTLEEAELILDAILARVPRYIQQEEE